MRIAVDMDEVLADTLAKELKVYNQLFKTDFSRKDLEGTTFEALVPGRDQAIQDYLNEESFFSDLDVMPGAQRVVKVLMEAHEVFVTTAAMEFPASFHAKFTWLKQHFPFIPADSIVFCGSKSIIKADYLIDDNIKHFQDFDGKGILFSAPHNLHLEYRDRVSSWDEVERLFG